MTKASGTHLSRLEGHLFSFCFPVICLPLKSDTWLSENVVLDYNALVYNNGKRLTVD